ncbi:MAG: hypothetical protein H3C30_05820 [Candidatus Hydrogenedentes bacterium]|nr:hypothetical protein [Candidatus Hydrogenedentota bacterium]
MIFSRMLAACGLLAAPALAQTLTPEILQQVLPESLGRTDTVIEVMVAHVEHSLAGNRPEPPPIGIPPFLLPYSTRLVSLRGTPGETPYELRMEGVSEAAWMPGHDERGILLLQKEGDGFRPSGRYPVSGYYPVNNSLVEYPPFSGNTIPVSTALELFGKLASGKGKGVPEDGCAELGALLRGDDLPLRTAALTLLLYASPDCQTRRAFSGCVGELHTRYRDTRDAETRSTLRKHLRVMICLAVLGMPDGGAWLAEMFLTDLRTPEPAFVDPSLLPMLLERVLALSPPERGHMLEELLSPCVLRYAESTEETRHLIRNIAPLEILLTETQGEDISQILLGLAREPQGRPCVRCADDLLLLWRILGKRGYSSFRDTLRDFLAATWKPNLSLPPSDMEQAMLDNEARRILGEPSTP